MDKSLWEKSQQFFAVMGAERPDELGGSGLASRLDEIRAEIEETGSYVHTPRELEFGARLA